MRLLVLQHCPVTPIGLVGERAVERGAELVTLFPMTVTGCRQQWRDSAD